MLRPISFFLCCAALVACASSTPPTPAKTTAITVSAPDAAAPEVKAAPAITEAEARALFDRWLSAQNAGQFKDYEPLYATRFTGVRRSGARVARLDREHWMKERQQMFATKTTVAASDVRVTVTGGQAQIRFVQTWESPTYADKGAKLVVLVHENGGTKIAREEMLSSEISVTGSAEDHAFVVNAPGPMLVLHAKPDEAWATGKLTLASRGSPVVVRSTVNMTKLPPAFAAWRGRKVQLFTAKGLACEGTVSDLAIVSRGEPHFGTRSKWDGAGDFAGEPKATDDEVALAAWFDEGLVLAAEVKPNSGACKDARWGRAAKAQMPALAEATAADPKTQLIAKEALRKLPEYAAIQKEYESQRQASDPKLWDEFGGARGDARVIRHPNGQLIVTYAADAGRGCGEFEGFLLMAWRLEGGRLLPAMKPTSSDHPTPLGAADVDGDGRVELFLDSSYTEMVYRGTALGFEPWKRITIPFYDCPC